VEDDPSMRQMLRYLLQSGDMEMIEATSGSDGLAFAARLQPRMILLDLGLPDIDGVELIVRLRKWMADPILVISARGQESEKVRALDAGANDYLTKPFAAGELLARIRVWLRRTKRPAPDSETIEVGDLRIDMARRIVVVRGREVHLTPTEYSLFATLMQHAGCVMTHRQLLLAAWGPTFEFETHYLRIYMRQLRLKLETDAGRPGYLRSEPGIGYRLCAPST
jgi:two-component system KDP operon response regulator KdpE